MPSHTSYEITARLRSIAPADWCVYDLESIGQAVGRSRIVLLE